MGPNRMLTDFNQHSFYNWAKLKCNAEISRIKDCKTCIILSEMFTFIIFVVLFMKKESIYDDKILSPKFLLLILWFASGTLLCFHKTLDMMRAWEQLNNAELGRWSYITFWKGGCFTWIQRKICFVPFYLYSHLGKPELSSRYFGEFLIMQ